MKSYKAFKKQLLNNGNIRKAYNELELEYALVQMIVEKRVTQGLTQAELAKKAGTKQSAISRLECGTYNPTLAFLQKIAAALGSELRISFS